MIAYSVIMFLFGAVFFALGILIYRGKTELIHSYHRTKVSDRAGYGRAFGRAMLLIALSVILSGIIGLFASSRAVAAAAVATLIIGLAAGIACIIAVQFKYNKGIF